MCVKTTRRNFIRNVVPVCALSCVAAHSIMGSNSFHEFGSLNIEDDKFQKEMNRTITYKQWIEQRHNKYIKILKHLEKDIGKQKLVELLKKASYSENFELGKRLAERILTFEDFKKPFKDESGALLKTLNRQIVEDSERAFEMRVTDCISEIVFEEADAQYLGFACICHAVFALPIGINPKFKLIRSKTLMQGHDCCNHRYIWEK